MAKLNYKKLKSLENVFKEINSEKGKLGLTLVEEALFLGSTLAELKKKVAEEGVITEMSQGAYSINRENPALKSYNTSIKNYQSLIKQITDLLNEEGKSIEDEFDDFNK